MIPTRHRLIVCLFLLKCLILIVDANAHDTPILCKNLKSIEVKGLRSMQVSEFINLMDFKIGQPLYRQDLSRSVKRAFRKGIFDDIVLIKKGDDDDCSIEIEVKEKPIISSIQIEGNIYFSASQIKKHLNIETRQILNLLQIRQAIKAVKEFMRLSGFPEAEATYRIVRLDEYRVELHTTIKEGRPELIRELKIHDSSSLLQRYLTLSEGDPFNVISINKTKERIADYLRRNRYLQTDLLFSYKDGVLTTSFNIGKRLKVALIGNESVERSELMKELPYVDITEFSDATVEEFRKRLLGLYHSKGYPFVQIIPSVEHTDDAVELSFFIFEGRQYVVLDVDFKNTSLSSDKLSRLLNLREGRPYNPELVDTDIANLKDFYASIGYREVTIAPPEILFTEEGVRIVYAINEGTQNTIREIEFVGNSVFSSNQLMKEIVIKPEEPLNELDLAESRRRILDLYRKMGFADAQISIARKETDGVVDITFNIKEGVIILFGKTLFKGNINTKDRALYRELLHKEGDLFQQAIILKERQRLYRTGLFSDIDIDTSEAYSRQDQVDGAYYRDVIFTVQEAPAGAFEFGVGYGEYERFRGFAELSYKNLWGMNRQGGFRTELSSIEQRYVLSYFDPWFFGENLPLRGLLLHEKKTERSLDTKQVRYRLRRTNASVGVERRLSSKVNSEFFYDFSVVNTFDVKPDIILSRDDTGTLIISALRSALIYDTRDNPFEPTEGFLAGITAKIASFLLLSQTDFLKVAFYGNNYQKLSKHLVLALSLRGGIAKGIRKTHDLPIVERFFLGGRTTVRGYEQDTLGPKGVDGNPTGGNLFSMGSLELRTNIGKGFGLVTFMDTGNVWQTFSDIGGVKFTAGLGIRYNTPVGPLRVDYGLKINRRKGESKGEIHFSLGHAF